MISSTHEKCEPPWDNYLYIAFSFSDEASTTGCFDYNPKKGVTSQKYWAFLMASPQRTRSAPQAAARWLDGAWEEEGAKGAPAQALQ